MPTDNAALAQALDDFVREQGAFRAELTALCVEIADRQRTLEAQMRLVFVAVCLMGLIALVLYVYR